MTTSNNDDQQFLARGSGLVKLLEHRSRLTILVLLARHDEMNFRRLKELLQETDGNLGAHLRKLETSELVAVRKVFEHRKPTSWYQLTTQGREALTQHVAALRSLTVDIDFPTS